MTLPPLTWVVGAGGLLGSSVAARIPTEHRWIPTGPVVWGTPGTATQVAALLADFTAAAGDRGWRLAWCAGAGVTSTSAGALAAELAVFDQAMSALGSVRPRGRGSLFVASSAGGVYAGSLGAPHDERTDVVPISGYGQAKLAIEHRAIEMSRRTGIPLLIGRISNLYGPNQNLSKPQGLISHIVRAHLLNRSVSIYVPLDTVRDNVFVDDAARLVTAGLDRLEAESRLGRDQQVVKIMASQQGVTIGFLIAELARIFKRRPRVVFGNSPASAFQVRDLRMRSVVWPELDVPTVPLPVGMLQTVEALTRSHLSGRLA